MKNILFVDDDSDIRQELKKLLQPLHKDWNIEFAMSGKGALDLLSKSKFDVIVSDMHMPEMDGVELLGIVMEQYPEVVRIIFSRHSDKERILGSVKCTHQFLAKPCDSNTIKYTIERTCKLQNLLRNETLRKMVAGIKDLPSLPSLYGLIVKEMQSPDASLKKVGYIISQDISMSAKILQLVNSAYFGLPRKMTDPQQAAIYLGVETLKTIVLSSHVFSAFTEEAESCGFSLADMWRHSLMTGRLAKEIARAESADKESQEEALTAGVLHDIGKLILLKIPDQYKKILAFIEKSGCNFVEAEYAVLKTSHAELGAYLLGLWGIDDKIVETVAFHHNPSNLLEDLLVMLSKPSKENADDTKLMDSELNSWSVEKCIEEFGTLTAVHVANSLLIQKDCSYETTVFPNADLLYLRTLNLTDKMPKWVGSYKVMQEMV